MEKITLGLAVVITLFYISIPPAHALNCTEYNREQRDLCNSVDSLDLSDDDKILLIQQGDYNLTYEPEQINLKLNIPAQEIQTTEQIYEENIALLVKIITFVVTNYTIFSFLTKPQILLRWLTAVS